ncbi:hypothetical protein BH09BAC3_BH09BAC3_15920 [soil metagenome]
MKKGVILVALICISSLGQSQTPLIDSLLKIVARHPRDTNEIRALDQLASEFARRDLDRSTQYARQQIALAKSLNTTFGLSGGYSWMATRNQNLGRIDSAKYYLDLMGEIAKKNPNDFKSNSNYNNSVGLFYRNQSELNKALPYQIEALKWIRLSKDRTGEAGQLLNIGNTYQRLGQLKNAASHHIQSLTIFEEVKNKRGQSFCLNSLGNDYYSLKQFKAAEKYFFRSVKLKEELGDRRGMVSSWQSLGSMYHEMSRYDLALKYALKALERAHEIKMMTDEVGIQINLGRIYRDTHRVPEARKAYEQALLLARQSGDSLFVSTIKSDITLLDDNLKSEEQLLIKNVTISMEKGDRPTSADAYHRLAEWYAKHDEFEKAFDNLTLYNQLNDSVRGNSILLQIKELEEGYKSEQKEKEITLLKKDQQLQNLELSRHKLINTSIAIALGSVVIIAFLLINRYRVVNKAKRLVEIERVRNNIARDLHDDIGSTLSSINILSQIALQEKNGNSQLYLQRIGDQSSRIMENMGDMVWSINPRNDTISQIVIKMREFASEILEPQNIEFRFTEKVSPQLIVDTDKRKNLFMIFKETINNAAKYSKAELVEINLEEKENSLVLRIKDNGQGFDERNTRNGNGLRNLRERGKEANGAISLISKVGEGTTMELIMPLT